MHIEYVTRPFIAQNKEIPPFSLDTKLSVENQQKLLENASPAQNQTLLPTTLGQKSARS
jgi:hypothetical protein